MGPKSKYSFRHHQFFSLTHLQRSNRKKIFWICRGKEGSLCKEKKIKTHKNVGQEAMMHSYFKTGKREHLRPNDLKQRRMVKALLFSFASGQLPLTDWKFGILCLCAWSQTKVCASTLNYHQKYSSPTEYYKHVKYIENRKKDLKRVFSTLDLWANHQMTSFFGVTVHFFNGD